MALLGAPNFLIVILFLTEDHISSLQNKFAFSF